MRSRAAFMLALTMMAGCGSQPRVVVDLVTDLGPVTEFARVSTQRLADRGRVADERSEAADARGDYVRGVRIAELTGLSVGTHTLRVALLDATRRVLVERSVRVVVVEGTTAVTVLITRSCRDVACPGPSDDAAQTECSGGRCVDPRCRPEAPEACLPAACAEDGECTPAMSCAVGRCVAGECLFADEGACGAARWCHPEEGCLELVEMPDGGPVEVDGGPVASDGGPGDAGTCVPRTCTELGLECGVIDVCGASMSCGVCTAPDTCGGGGIANRCGNGDVTGPSLTITSGPSDPTRDTSATFTLVADDGPGVGVDRVECRIDGEAYAPCTSVWVRDGIGEGTHTFEARAIDRAGNPGEPAMYSWTIDRSDPVVDIAPITDPAPASYTATASVAFSFTCGDALTRCDLPTRRCFVDGTPVSCSTTGGSFMAGYTGAFVFGSHTLRVSIDDAAGNTGTATRAFNVTRCANDMQFPARTSEGVARGSCCSGLVVSSWMDFSFGYWHPRGDGSCRPMSDYDSRPFETIWGGGTCVAGMTTYQWLQARSLPGCSGVVGRAACVGNETEARVYCGTDGGSGTQTPFHGRASEGWHPPPSAGCSGGLMSGSLLMQRYGAHDACFGSVDRITDRGSGRSSDACATGLTRYCRTSPVDTAVACVCASSNPYASDGRN